MRSARPGGGPESPFSLASVSRRNLLRGGLAGAALGLSGGLSACGTAFGAGVAGSRIDPAIVTYWNLFGGGDGGRMQDMEAGYTATHGGPSSVEAATFAWGNPYYTKLSLATLSGKPPDVAVSHLTRAKNLAAAGLLTEITDDLLALGGLSADDFDQSVWENQKVDGKAYAIPLDTHPFVLFYNAKVCKAAGLLDEDNVLKPIEGAEGWEAALTAAKKVDGVQWGAAIATISDTSTSWRWFLTLYGQLGGTPFLADDGQRLTIDDDKAIQALEYIQMLTKTDLMASQVDYDGSEQAMLTGQAAFYLQGEWEITTCQTYAEANEDFAFGMGQVPNIFGKQAAQADSHMFVLPTKSRDDDQNRLAMGFVKSLLDQSDTWAQGGHVPSYLPYFNSPEYKKLEPQAQYSAAAATAVYDPPAWYSGSGSNFEVVTGSEIGLVQQGLTDPASALKSIKDQLTTYANTPNPLA
jgi:multiple sugar transport system substrate-binding protein